MGVHIQTATVKATLRSQALLIGHACCFATGMKKVRRHVRGSEGKFVGHAECVCVWKASTTWEKQIPIRTKLAGVVKGLRQRRDAEAVRGSKGVAGSPTGFH